MSIYLAASMSDDGCIQIHQMVSLASVLKTVRVTKQPILAIWNNPKSIDTADDFIKLMKGRRMGDRKFKICNDDVHLIYRQWRRAFYMGATVSETFNIEGSDLPNKLINAKNHLPFDIRLGYLVTLDQRILRLLGKMVGPEDKLYESR